MASKLLSLGVERINVELRDLGLALTQYQAEYGPHSRWLTTFPAEKTEHLEADGFLTDQKEVGLGILTADCIPVFFYVPGREVIGLAHAGWRGLKADILVKMVEKMKALWGIHPKDIRAALGPAIRKCCYEVGPEFHELFKGFCIQSKDQVKPHLDLISFAQSQLLNLGIRPEHCFDSEICTACQNPQFFSWRKENTKERILSVLWLPMAKPEQN